MTDIVASAINPDAPPQTDQNAAVVNVSPSEANAAVANPAVVTAETAVSQSTTPPPSQMAAGYTGITQSEYDTAKTIYADQVSNYTASKAQGNDPNMPDFNQTLMWVNQGQPSNLDPSYTAGQFYAPGAYYTWAAQHGIGFTYPGSGTVGQMAGRNADGSMANAQLAADSPNMNNPNAMYLQQFGQPAPYVGAGGSLGAYGINPQGPVGQATSTQDAFRQQYFGALQSAGLDQTQQQNVRTNAAAVYGQNPETFNTLVGGTSTGGRLNLNLTPDKFQTNPFAATPAKTTSTTGLGSAAGIAAFVGGFGGSIGGTLAGKAAKQGYAGGVSVNPISDMSGGGMSNKQAKAAASAMGDPNFAVNAGNFYVPYGKFTQTELQRTVGAVNPVSGELSFYQSNKDINTGEFRRPSLIGGGGIGAAQSGMFTANRAQTPFVVSQERAGIEGPATEAQTKGMSGLGAEVYGGRVQPLDSRTVQSTGAVYGQFPDNPNNLANYANPQGVNLGKAEMGLSNIPWSASPTSPYLQTMGPGGLTGTPAVNRLTGQTLSADVPGGRISALEQPLTTPAPTQGASQAVTTTTTTAPEPAPGSTTGFNAGAFLGGAIKTTVGAGNIIGGLVLGSTKAFAAEQPAGTASTDFFSAVPGVSAIRATAPQGSTGAEAFTSTPTGANPVTGFLGGVYSELTADKHWSQVAKKLDEGGFTKGGIAGMTAYGGAVGGAGTGIKAYEVLKAVGIAAGVTGGAYVAKEAYEGQPLVNLPTVPGIASNDVIPTGLYNAPGAGFDMVVNAPGRGYDMLVNLPGAGASALMNTATIGASLMGASAASATQEASTAFDLTSTPTSKKEATPTEADYATPYTSRTPVVDTTTSTYDLTSAKDTKTKEKDTTVTTYEEASASLTKSADSTVSFSATDLALAGGLAVALPTGASAVMGMSSSFSTPSTAATSTAPVSAPAYGATFAPMTDYGTSTTGGSGGRQSEIDLKMNLPNFPSLGGSAGAGFGRQRGARRYTNVLPIGLDISFASMVGGTRGPTRKSASKMPKMQTFKAPKMPTMPEGPGMQKKRKTKR